MSSAPQRSAGGQSQLLLLVTVLIVAANLRPAITAVGPLIERIGEDTGIGPAALGLLGAIPALGFGGVALFVAAAGRRWGLERTIFVSLLLLTLGTVLRSLPLGAFSLFAGTVILSAAVGVGNVLVPAVVKRDFPGRVPAMTGLYTAVLVGCAAVASGTAVPMAEALGWELTLAASALLALVSAGVWSTRLNRPRGVTSAGDPVLAAPEPPGGSMWRSAVAWQVTAYFALQSGVFYLMLTWFPAIQTWHGVSEASAGFWLGAYQAIGILASLVVGGVMQRAGDQRLPLLALAAIMLCGVLGIIALPAAMPAWALIVGFASGGNLLVGLTLISMRARTAGDASRLSGMAQGVGYLLAAIGPLLAGSLFELTGTWSPVLWIVVGAVLVMAVVGVFAGRNVHVP
ncbi:MFS transporter [Nesterenkonia lutea]|uniref:CP family cyanate transporter-like MFS transporter n=1 Tax=Nesterenkonia lutea TaxID=272919 RepID=A0ABR9JE01_9MICC|nr:MFS transporter [Nesterenkonia lutea]MBE1524010.1 CP family cyanate transporter-like MFS transporter [Nesterenkonia lutea]